MRTAALVGLLLLASIPPAPAEPRATEVLECSASAPVVVFGLWPPLPVLPGDVLFCETPKAWCEPGSACLWRHTLRLDGLGYVSGNSVEGGACEGLFACEVTTEVDDDPQYVVDDLCYTRDLTNAVQVTISCRMERLD